MFETLFRAGFVLALVLPPLAVVTGAVFLFAPKLRSAPHAAKVPVHP